ncbi:NAD(P)-binding protein [Xylariaceae sp. FL1651]|nr:NAD(P)-binding protein [Xylariaceae sp. FL1651]
MGVNATGVMHCLKAQTGFVADNGSLVYASSIAGQTGRLRNAAQTASKHAVTGLTRSVDKEIGHRSVRVNAVCPGRILMPMLHASFEPKRRRRGEARRGGGRQGERADHSRPQGKDRRRPRSSLHSCLVMKLQFHTL